MRLIRRHIFRNIYISLLILLFYYYVYKTTSGLEDEDDWESVKLKLGHKKHHRSKHNSENEIFPDSDIIPGTKYKKIDWHNHTHMEADRLRTGPGEQGIGHQLKPGLDKEEFELYNTNGFNALLSDEIALDRALKDFRNPKCKDMLYYEKLPSVSVVIPFFEEHETTLKRTVVSVINRSPKHILKEIILVDDGSFLKSKEFLRAPLDAWLKEKYPIGRVVRLPERMGLIQARQTGCLEATGDVIVVLDSHCEVMHNWLPPLIDPIVDNYRTAVCPLIDGIDKKTFSYGKQDDGGRGAFDWKFYYKRLPLFKEDREKLPEPFEDPIMNGGLFAISRKFFFELGGYDTGIRIWGGEQYDLSFKIWQCHGRMLDAPCSRVGHIFRDAPSGRPSVHFDYLSVNYKRVALVWMDEYAEHLFRRSPHLREVDAGDISGELAIREHLKCNNFKWFLDNVAPDLEKLYPAVEPPDFGNGTIQSMADSRWCMDNGPYGETGTLILYGCHGGGSQYFSLCHKKTIRVESEQFCWLAPHTLGKEPSKSHCQKEHIPSMTWRYDPVTYQLQNEYRYWCLEADIENKIAVMAECNPDKKEQMWKFKNVNEKEIAERYPPFQRS